MRKFDYEFKRLNDMQQKAVETIDGPLLVVAGPGTGKTQLLSMRVANILQKADVYPSNVLCLTFTNKATDNMRRRLQELVGDDALGVQVKTFHGLAADIMNRYPEYFWRGAQLAIAPDAIQLEILQDVLRKLPEDHPLALNFSGQFTLAQDVSRSIQLAKEAGLTPEKLRALIKVNIAYLDVIEPNMIQLADFSISAKQLPKVEAIIQQLPDQPIDDMIQPLVSLATIIHTSYEQAQKDYEESGKTRALSAWKARWIQKEDGVYGMFHERKRNEWWLAIADAYEGYRQSMHTRGYYDYADMLVEVIGQLEQHNDLQAQLQEQFQYVLIDEFQDTNAAQLRLAHLIADHPDLEKPNIMGVGDDDQSIFKFQGAELSNMLGFARQYTSAKMLVLTENYRSTQPILDTTSDIISHADYRLVNELEGLSKKLIAKDSEKTKSLIEHRSYRSREEQLDGLADEAGTLWKKGQSVAVLARRHASLRDMAMVLHSKGIPIAYEQQNNLLEQPAIEQLCIILSITSHAKKGNVDTVNELLSKTLSHPMWDIDPKLLWQFAINQQVSRDWLGGLLTSKDKRLQASSNWFTQLVKQSASEPLAVVMEFALGLRDNDILESPVRAYFLSASSIDESYIETLSAIQTLRGLVTEFRSVRVTTVDDFVQFIDLMKANGKIISDNSPFISGKNRVELLSVHKAKGLEFDAVIIIDAVESEWSPRNRGRVPPANLPLRPAEDDIDDYVRLMYVAATRAKHTLLFGSYAYSNKGEEVLPASSISQVKVTEQAAKQGKELIGILERTLRWPRLEQHDEKTLLAPRLESYVLNVSNLINFLDVTKGGPEYFKERNLLRLPEAKSSSAGLGTAVHRALQETQLLHNTTGIKLNEVLAIFEKTLQAEGLPETEFKRNMAKGKRILTRFLKDYGWEFIKGAKPEYVISDVLLGEAKLSGTLDVVQLHPDAIVVQDYKTGRALKSLSISSGNEGLKAWRHKLQLMFYALLLGEDSRMSVLKRSVTGQMVYVEADKKQLLSLEYQPTEEDLVRLKTLITAVWEHIQRLDLPDTSAYSPDLKGVRAFEQDLLDKKI